jgi:hypothetical protein
MTASEVEKLASHKCPLEDVHMEFFLTMTMWLKNHVGCWRILGMATNFFFTWYKGKYNIKDASRSNEKRCSNGQYYECRRRSKEKNSNEANRLASLYWVEMTIIRGVLREEGEYDLGWNDELIGMIIVQVKKTRLGIGVMYLA